MENFSAYHWNEEDSLYYPFDIVIQEQIKKHCSGCYIPIFAGIPSTEQFSKLINHLDNYNNFIQVPSCFPDQEGFQQKKYWRGPVWININWMIWKGLLKYGMIELAGKIKDTTLQLVEKYGTYEYFDPYKDTTSTIGLGGADFSWTAALIIDMLRSEKV